MLIIVFVIKINISILVIFFLRLVFLLKKCFVLNRNLMRKMIFNMIGKIVWMVLEILLIEFLMLLI